ncbi:coiled-coil domain-containing protein 18-like [Xenia sp. Carnegie-2017]|uniref:coiled-coil domain-containing protein 18-like n=1 Tax=Xenia sp. Carnegie-2017 TaxID=2897299 RepID=UPI001F047755|nr:coiled-coil domain-containing protein 18-like [Xenia sp. Carnegie-2017]
MLRQLKSDSDLDRGDAPALAVIRANAEQKALRKAVETQEELHRIRERICWTLSAYEVGEELTTKILEEKKNSFVKEDAELQFFDDIATLTVILSDPIAKQKYQQKVTIFVVGYEDMCSERSKLLIQLQQFFKQNSASDDDFIMNTPEIDFDEVENNVREALDKAEKTTERLANISKDVLKVFEMVNPKDHKKGKRKLEKALFQSQQDVVHLTEKLVEVQSDFEETKTKLATLTQTVDLKEAELDRIKTEFNVNKGFEKECENYKKALQAKDEQLKTLKVQMEETEMSLSQAESKYDDYVEMCRNLRDENQYLRDETERKTNEQEERITQITKDLQNKYEAELSELKTMKNKELNQLKDAHEEELLGLKGKLSFQRRSITTSSTRDDSIPLESRGSATFSTTQSDDALQALSTWKSSAKTSRTIVEIRTSETSLEKTYSSDMISEEKSSAMSELESRKMADTTEPATLKTAETIKTIERSCQTDDFIENLDEMNELHKLKSKKDLLEIERDMVKTPTEELPQKLDEYKSKFSEVEQQLREEILQWKLRFNNKSLALDELSKNQEAQSKENQNLLEQLALAQNEKMDAENEAERAILELEEMKAEKDSISDMTDMIEEKDNVISTESKTTVATEILDCLQTAHDNERTSLVSADMQCASTQVSRKPSARSSVNSDMLDIRGVGTQVSRRPSARSSPNSDTLDIRCGSTQVSSKPSAKSLANNDTTDEPEIVVLVQGLDVPDNKFDNEMDANKLTLPTRSNTSTASIGRVRSRLIRTAIKDHRVIEETVKTHEMISKFKVDIVIWLEQHGLGHKTELLNSIPDVPLDKGDEIDILKNISSIRNITHQVLDALWQITKDDYSWSHHKLVDGDETPEEMDVGHNLGHHDSEVEAEMDIGYDDPYTELGAEKDIGYDDPSAEEGAEKDAQDGQRPSLESPEKISEIDGASTSVHQEPNLQDRSIQTIFVPRGAPTTPKGYTRLLHEYNNLNEEYNMLTQQLQDSVKSYQEQISQNATVMNEMQETINNLKTQLMEKFQVMVHHFSSPWYLP